MTLYQNADKIRNIVNGYILDTSHSDLSKLSPQTLLFREGIFDSMAFVLLIDFIEEKFGIKPSDEDLVENNFESIEAITKYIQQKQQNLN